MVKGGQWMGWFGKSLHLKVAACAPAHMCHCSADILMHRLSRSTRWCRPHSLEWSTVTKTNIVGGCSHPRQSLSSPNTHLPPVAMPTAHRTALAAPEAWFADLTLANLHSTVVGLAVGDAAVNRLVTAQAACVRFITLCGVHLHQTSAGSPVSRHLSCTAAQHGIAFNEAHLFEGSAVV